MKRIIINIFAVVGAVFLVIIGLSMLIAILAGDSMHYGDKVAIVEINGIILNPDAVNHTLNEYRVRDDIKAVVLRINSPGGSVGPSQEIYDEVKRLQNEKPVVVSMGAVAASGGYYIAVAADKIVANPGTITGSIGVIIEFMNVEGLFDKIGLKTNTVKSGHFKDTGSPTKELAADERKLLQALIDDVHSQFVLAVVEGRNMTDEEVRAVADGRILSGSQAMEAGLVDRLGNLTVAIELGAELAGIEGEPNVLYPPPPGGFINELFGSETSGKLAGFVSGFKIMYKLPNFAG